LPVSLGVFADIFNTSDCQQIVEALGSGFLQSAN